MTSSSSTDNSILSLQNVEVNFENSSRFLDLFSEPEIVRAVDGVSLEIPKNQVIAMVGESGCGKTTLGKTAIGLQRPTEGSVCYRGQDIWNAKDKRGDVEIPYTEIRKSLQIIHQDPGSSLNPNQKVLKSLAAPLKKWQSNLTKEDRHSRIIGMLDTVGMTPAQDYINRYPHQLSGGEKQRIALVRALLMNPDVILADEAISALDVSLRVEMMDLFLDLQNRFNSSFIFISHDLSNARYLAEKANGLIAIMYLGEIVEIGPAAQIINNPSHPYTQALRWATPDLRPNSTSDDMPMRKIDVPDPINPPSGCRFHTRCPKARKTCVKTEPELFQVDEDDQQQSACFRVDTEHEYWDSQPLSDVEQEVQGND
jgi:peptide/nickel transport system ATP-binding protein